jgi:hypothetical protein
MSFFAQSRPSFVAFVQPLVVALLTATSSPSALADATGPIADPNSVAKEITSILADGHGDAAADAIVQDINGSGPAMSSKMTLNEQNMKAGFKIITQNGKAVSFDKIQQEDFGSSVKVIVYYLNYPKGAGDDVNQFVFNRYTFMKVSGGWSLTDFTFTTSSVYPPTGWTLLNTSK